MAHLDDVGHVVHIGRGRLLAGGLHTRRLRRRRLDVRLGDGLGGLKLLALHLAREAGDDVALLHVDEVDLHVNTHVYGKRRK